jgi:uncharacterized RDD family membrane protein YckC
MGMSETPERDDRQMHRAVCFDRRDYAGLVRRVVIVCIDFVATVVLSFGALIGIWYVWPILYPGSARPPEVMWAVPTVAYLYLTMLQRSRIRTLGYIVTGVRIVGIEGKRPSLLQMTVRLIPLMPVPWSLLFDLGWMVDDPRKQTLRDKWAGTFVVRRKAQPIGTAPVRYKRIGFSGVFLIFPEIGRVEEAPQPPAEPSP